VALGGGPLGGDAFGGDDGGGGDLDVTLVTLASASHGVATASGSLDVVWELGGTAHGVATCAAVLHTDRLEGTSVGVATVVGTVLAELPLSASTSVGLAAMSAALAGLASEMSGLSVGTAVSSGGVEVSWLLEGISIGHATATATIDAIPVFAKLSGSRGARDGGMYPSNPFTFPAPDNDEISGAFVLATTGGTTTFDTTYATQASGESDWPGGVPAGQTLWWVFTANADGTLRLSTGPTNDGTDPHIATWLGCYSSSDGDYDDLVPLTVVSAVVTYDVGGSASYVQQAVTNGDVIFVRLAPASAVNYADLDLSVDTTDYDDPYGIGPGTLSWDFVPTTPGAYVDSDDIDGIYTPGALDITLGNLPPNSDVTFAVDSLSAPPFDLVQIGSSGDLYDHSVIIPFLMTAGDHTLYGFVSDGSIFSLVFTVLVDAPLDAPEADDVTPTLIPRSGVQRWIFQDPTGTAYPGGTGDELDASSYIVPINPDKMTTPWVDKQITTEATVGIPGQPITWESNPQAPLWTFSGVILDGNPANADSHLSILRYFAHVPYEIYIVDHFNRAWRVYIASFDPVPAQTVQHMYRHTYTMTAYMTALDGQAIQLS
jgi:hypothetical protein